MGQLLLPFAVDLKVCWQRMTQFPSPFILKEKCSFFCHVHFTSCLLSTLRHNPATIFYQSWFTSSSISPRWLFDFSRRTPAVLPGKHLMQNSCNSVNHLNNNMRTRQAINPPWLLMDLLPKCLCIFCSAGTSWSLLQLITWNERHHTPTLYLSQTVMSLNVLLFICLSTSGKVNNVAMQNGIKSNKEFTL